MNESETPKENHDETFLSAKSNKESIALLKKIMMSAWVNFYHNIHNLARFAVKEMIQNEDLNYIAYEDLNDNNSFFIFLTSWLAENESILREQSVKEYFSNSGNIEKIIREIRTLSFGLQGIPKRLQTIPLPGINEIRQIEIGDRRVVGLNKNEVLNLDPRFLD